MSDLQIQTEQPPSAQVPLLTSISNQNNNQQQQNHEIVSNTNNNNHNSNHDTETKTETETELDQTLARVETFLTLLGFNQRSIFTFLLSWTVFAAVGVALPLVALRFTKCDSSLHCEMFEIKSFEIDIVAFQAILAAVSLLCLSHNLRKYGLRRFLFVDRHSGNLAYFHNDYVKQIKVGSD
ncbi:hypothetical protein RIF29_41835 [Crotalaria pallida]|uniref:Uncharacterized protein n=1 Tax=Crotalaria pallida TaxID=3830 RepID=A0AAN9HT39_CROPI